MNYCNVCEGPVDYQCWDNREVGKCRDCGHVQGGDYDTTPEAQEDVTRGTSPIEVLEHVLPR